MKCPRYFQDRIDRAGGMNRYGGPNFRLAWSKDERFRAGGVWPADRFAGYRQVYAANCSPYPPKDGYWMLMEWEGPESFGGEGLYFFVHRDEKTGLCNTGPYPHRGRYKLAVKLVWTTVENGVLTFEPWPLDSRVIDMIIPTVIQARKDSLAVRMRKLESERQEADRRLASKIETVMNDAKRPLTLPSRIEDRIRMMEKQWAEFLSQPRQVKAGFQQA